MKYLLLSSMCLLSLNAFAVSEKDYHKKMNKMTFEDAKKMNMDLVDKKSEIVEENRKCINDAKDKKDLSQCMKRANESEREMKTSWYKEFKTDVKEAKEKVKEKM